MLRQVFVLKNAEVIYTYMFGTAFSPEIMTQVKETLAEFIRDPVEGTIFSRPLFNFQAIYAGIQQLFFLFVTDQSDRPEYVKEVIKPTAAKFSATFPNIPVDLKDTDKQSSFERYLLEVYTNLHPKIALVGPLGAGKTTLAKLTQTKEGTERAIMNFGKIYPIQIGKLTFDLWDWVFPDMFSPLWNNFIRGSDVILVVMDSTAEGVKGVTQFVMMQQREAKSARIAALCNKQDLPGALSPEQIKTQVTIPTYGITATSVQAKYQFLTIIEQILDLKKPLPPEFKELVKSANEAIGKENFEKAIADLEKLVVIATQFQEMAFVTTFQDKLTTMKQKLVEKKKRDEIESRKIKAPDVHKFTQKVEVKTLLPKPIAPAPNINPAGPSSPPPSHPIPISLPTVVSEPLTPQINSATLKVTPGSIPAPRILPTPEPTNLAKSPPETGNKISMQDLAQKLMNSIQSKGASFSLANCRLFAEKMVSKLGRTPTDAELDKAAQAIVVQVMRPKPPA